MSSQADAFIALPSTAVFYFGGTELKCDAPIHLTIRSGGAGGATLDGEGRSRIFSLADGCSLSLEGVSLVNGRAENVRGPLAADEPAHPRSEPVPTARACACMHFSLRALRRKGGGRAQ